MILGDVADLRLHGRVRPLVAVLSDCHPYEPGEQTYVVAHLSGIPGPRTTTVLWDTVEPVYRPDFDWSLSILKKHGRLCVRDNVPPFRGGSFCPPPAHADALGATCPVVAWGTPCRRWTPVALNRTLRSPAVPVVTVPTSWEFMRNDLGYFALHVTTADAFARWGKGVRPCVARGHEDVLSWEVYRGYPLVGGFHR